MVLSLGNNMVLSLEKVDQSSLSEMIYFLKRYENYTLFLLGNLADHGYILTEAPNSANYHIIRSSQEIIAVFALTKRGNLLIQSKLQEPIFEMLLQACLNEALPLSGLLGEWDFCSSFWHFLKTNNVIQTDIFTSKEILYSKEIPTFENQHHSSVRILIPNDFSQWEVLRHDYLAETGLPHDLTSQQLQTQFVTKTKEKIIWGCFRDNELISIAELNAKAFGMGQVGGVYTVPLCRNQGYAKSVLYQLIYDSYRIHDLHKLLIFTGEHNVSANHLYQSIDAKFIGYFGMFFGT